MTKRSKTKQATRQPTIKVTDSPVEGNDQSGLPSTVETLRSGSSMSASTAGSQDQAQNNHMPKSQTIKHKQTLPITKPNHSQSQKNSISKQWPWGWEALSAISTAIGTGFAILASYIAYQTFESTIDTAQKQLRAYVGVDDIDIELPSSKVENYQPVKQSLGKLIPDYLILKVKNTGSTPAKKVTTWINWEPLAFGYQLPEDFDFKDHESNIREPFAVVKSTFSLFPGNSRETITSIDDARCFIEAQSKKKSLYLYGYISYEDIYGREHKTNFCYAYQPYASASQQFLPCTIHQEVF